MGMQWKYVPFFIHMVLSALIIKYRGIIGIRIFLRQNLFYDSFWYNKVQGYHRN